MNIWEETGVGGTWTGAGRGTVWEVPKACEVTKDCVVEGLTKVAPAGIALTGTYLVLTCGTYTVLVTGLYLTTLWYFVTVL